MKNRFRLILLLSFALIAHGNPSYAVTASPYLSEDKDVGYNRSFFKHWIDANKNGCDTRAEVLISEAVVKPKVDKKCKITGGKWLSAYDNKSVTNASLLDVDHLVPLAEAWRSDACALPVTTPISIYPMQSSIVEVCSCYLSTWVASQVSPSLASSTPELLQPLR
jgi:hypothetical protein